MSELTREKIYKKELEKVGGEGNNNLQRIRSLGPYATVEYVNSLMSGALKRAIVEELPTEDIDTNTIYMVLDETASSGNVYNEYLYINNAWELIGTTAMETPHLYQHNITINHYDSETQIGYLANFKILNSNPTTFTLQDIVDFLVDNGFDGINDDWSSVKLYEASGTYGSYSGTEEFSSVEGIFYILDTETNENVLVITAQFEDRAVYVTNPKTLSDIVIQIM